MSDRFVPLLLVDAPDFRRLWLGQTISVLGDQVTQLGLPLVAVLTLGAAIGVREALFVVSIAACFGILWMIGSPILGLRDLPEAAG